MGLSAVLGNWKDRMLAVLQQPDTVKVLDKVSFTASVCLLMTTEYFLMKRPDWFPFFYTAVMLPLLVIRYLSYSNLNHHYFLLDFCYFANFLAFFHIWITPQSALVSRIVFLSSNGPVLWAIVAWRNSLVFHCPDKIISLAIHLLPALLSFCTRWNPSSVSSGCDADGSCASAWSIPRDIGLGILWYLGWQLAYVLKVDVWDSGKFSARPELETSLRWILRYKSPGIYELLHAIAALPGALDKDERLTEDTWKARIAFMFSQLVYTLLTLIPAALCFHFYWLHVLLLGVMCAASAWNGGGYYRQVYITAKHSGSPAVPAIVATSVPEPRRRRN